MFHTTQKRSKTEATQKSQTTQNQSKIETTLIRSSPKTPDHNDVTETVIAIVAFVVCVVAVIAGMFLIRYLLKPKVKEGDNIEEPKEQDILLDNVKK